MDSATEEIYFQKVEELVQDEDKIVTVPFLSRFLNITVQDSQKILAKYTKDQRKLHPNELAITYILSGYSKDTGKVVAFIKEDELEHKRKLLDNLDSEVLFSVQKCKQVDFNVLSLVDDVTTVKESPMLGCLVSKNCIKRTLRVKKLPTPPPSTIKGKSSFFIPKTDNTPAPVSKSESKPKQNGITNMFNKAPPAKANENTDKKLVSSVTNKPKRGLSAFLSKGTSSSSVKSEQSIKSESSIKKENSSDTNPSEWDEPMDVDFNEIEERTIKEEKEIKEEKAIKEEKEDEQIEQENGKITKEEGKKTKTPKKQNKNKKKRQRENSGEKEVKKRKRIIERNDSESDDLFENDDDDVIEKSDVEEEPYRPSSPIPKEVLAPKNKIRKAVDKTYMDEEGFIVTKTEYVYESGPEEEPEIIPKTEEIKPKMEKKSSASSENDISPTKGLKNKKGKKNNVQNQPTLMNFFKKK